MAKVVANEVFKDRKPPYKLRFESMAAELREGTESSQQAKDAVRAHFKKKGVQNADLLADHRVMHKCQGIIDDADLILVMEEQFLSSFPLNKTHLITQFFGAPGEIDDPWPSKDLRKYLECLNQLSSLLTDNYGRILHALKNLQAPKVIAVHSSLPVTEQAIKGLSKITKASCPVCAWEYTLYSPNRIVGKLSRTAREQYVAKLCGWLSERHKRKKQPARLPSVGKRGAVHPAKLVIPDELTA